MRNLAIARAGENSKHETWLSHPRKKNFDLLVAYYGDEPGKWKPKADIYDHAKGLKYPWFDAYLKSHPKVLDYDAVWLCDDDLEADTATVRDLFDIFHETGLSLGQGAQSLSSVVSFPHVRCVPGMLLRYVGFVEEQMPIFSKQCLRQLRDTMGETKSGWGLGIAWANLLGHPKYLMGVIDAAPIGHHRPLKAGEMYTQVLPAMGITARQELDAMRAKYRDEIRAVEYETVPLDPAHPLTKERLGRQSK